MELLLLFTSLLLYTARGSCSGVRGKQPHIVMILADDYGYHDIGYHGSVIKTPFLDGLAAGGVKLENYYVQPICTPTRSQLLSGRYQIHTGLQHGVIKPDQPNCLPLSEVTLADQLRGVGYTTHIVGKWHLGFCTDGCLPTNRGFDSFYGYLTGAEDYYTHVRDDGLDLRDNKDVVLTENGTYSTHLFTERTVKIINNQSQSDKPMFLYVPFQAVHSPLQVPSNYTDQYSWIKDSHRRQYAGMVSALDEAVANIVNTLKYNNMWENTVLIFSTDNGGQVVSGGNNWPLRGWKGSYWEGGVRGVGFVASPLLNMTGYINNQLIHVTDWYPTLLSLAGGQADNSKPLDGYNAWDTISGNSVSLRTELLHNIDPLQVNVKGKRYPGSLFDTRVTAALRVGKWKIVTGSPGNSTWVPPPTSGLAPISKTEPSSKTVWLFDIESDPEELSDVSGVEPVVMTTLLDRLTYYNNSAVPVIYPQHDPNADPKYHGGVWGPWL